MDVVIRQEDLTKLHNVRVPQQRVVDDLGLHILRRIFAAEYFHRQKLICGYLLHQLYGAERARAQTLDNCETLHLGGADRVVGTAGLLPSQLDGRYELQR